MTALTFPRPFADLPLSRGSSLALGLLMAVLAACGDMPTAPGLPVEGASTVPTATPDDSDAGSGQDAGSQAGGDDSTGGAPAPAGNGLFAGAHLYVESNSNAAKQATEWRSARPGDAAMMDLLAAESQAIWFGDWNPDPYEWVRKVTREVRGEGALPVYVLYNIPLRDCGLYSAGGASDAGNYAWWIGEISRAIGSGPAVVVLEPDAIANMDCLSAAQKKERLQLISGAIRTLKSSGNVAVYLDAGNPRWHGADEMASRLRDAGIDSADGFSLNVSNFIGDDENISYGSAISSLIGGKHFVIDSSRNGRGPTADLDWCNPAGRGLGTRPTTRTGHPLVDAFLWIKSPGESDGACKGGPDAGKWWAEYALDLIRNALWAS